MGGPSPLLTLGEALASDRVVGLSVCDQPSQYTAGAHGRVLFPGCVPRTWLAAQPSELADLGVSLSCAPAATVTLGPISNSLHIVSLHPQTGDKSCFFVIGQLCKLKKPITGI